MLICSSFFSLLVNIIFPHLFHGLTLNLEIWNGRSSIFMWFTSFNLLGGRLNEVDTLFCSLKGGGGGGGGGDVN